MSSIAIIGGLVLAGALGWWVNRRAAVLRALPSAPAGEPVAAAAADLAFLGLQPRSPAVVHFSAPWCGPCTGVRRVVDQVCAELDVAHREIDIDANPEAAQRFSVLSLPTTLIFDGDGRRRYRAAGVPTATDLRTALRELLA